jgi:stage V sporulation protein SpoVS
MKSYLIKLLAASLLAFTAGVSYAQETPSQAIISAKAAIEQAIKAGSNKDAIDDLATANSWLAEAEKTNSVINAVVTLAITDEARKARSEEIVYLATMAKIKAQTAEAKAKKQSVMASTQKVQKDLDGFTGALALAKNRQDEVNRLKAELEKSDTTAKGLKTDLEKANTAVKDLEAKLKEVGK